MQNQGEGTHQQTPRGSPITSPQSTSSRVQHPQSTSTRVQYPGLEPLRNQMHLIVKQDITDVFSNAKNHFKVITSDGQPIYDIGETTNVLIRMFLVSHQQFNLVFKDMLGNDIIFMEGQPGAIKGFGAGVSVKYQNKKIGEVSQADGCNPQYDILDENGQHVLIIQSPESCCCLGAGGTADFVILQPAGGRKIGKIGKEWGGLGREMFSSADTFGVHFPIDMPVTLKVILIAATIMIDFQFFEKR